MSVNTACIVYVIVFVECGTHGHVCVCAHTKKQTQDQHGDAYMSDDYTPEDYARVFQNILEKRMSAPAELAMCYADPGNVARAPHMRLVDCVLLPLAPPSSPPGELAPHAVAATRLVLLVRGVGCVFLQ